MATSTSPKAPAAPPELPAGDAPLNVALVRHHVWSAGDGSLQIPLAGLLASDPQLHDAELAPEEWQAKLDEYLSTPRPPHPTAE